MALPWRPSTGTRRPAQAAVAFVLLFGGGYATSRVVQSKARVMEGKDGGSLDLPRPYRPSTQVLRQEAAAPGKVVDVKLHGRVVMSVSCLPEDAAIACVQIATPILEQAWPSTQYGRLRFMAVDAAGREYPAWRSRLSDSVDGITAVRILRGYSKSPKGLKLLMLVNGEVEGSWPIHAVAPPRLAITQAEGAKLRPEGQGTARLTDLRGVVRLKIPVPGKGKRVLQAKPTRSTYVAWQSPLRVVDVPPGSPSADLSLFVPNAGDAKEVEIEAAAYEWIEQSVTVKFEGVILEMKDGAPTLVVPRDLEVKTERGWEIRLPAASDFQFRGAGTAGFSVEILWNTPRAQRSLASVQTFGAEILSPAPETLGLRALVARVTAANSWSEDSLGVSHRRERARGAIAPAVRTGPIGPLVIRVIRRKPKHLFSRRLILPISRASH